jgi:hypothetical protein
MHATILSLGELIKDFSGCLPTLSHFFSFHSFSAAADALWILKMIALWVADAAGFVSAASDTTTTTATATDTAGWTTDTAGGTTGNATATAGDGTDVWRQHQQAGSYYLHDGVLLC